MKRAPALWLRERVTLDEAAYLVQDKITGTDYDGALALLIEAVVSGELVAAIKTDIDPYTGSVVGPVDVSKTSVKVPILALWLSHFAPVNTVGNSTVTQPEATVTQPEVAAPVQWTPERRAELFNEHNILKAGNNKAPTKTLATKYKISEQRIRQLLKKDKKKPESGTENSWTAQLKVK